MRLPYAPSEPTDPTPENQAIYSRIAARRAPRPITKLDLALLHNPSIASGWNELLGAIRTKTSLSAADMELAICRIAILNGAVYEWFAHAPLALKGGVSRTALESVKGLKELGIADVKRTEGEEGLSRKQWVILVLTDQMTKRVSVEDEVMEALKEWFGDSQIVELTATVATYNCVSRFLVALDVCEMNGGEFVVPVAPQGQ
ncbi:hypothetical protein MBLNU457_g0066t1 [Dothideomycetes sp. NU457]